jgi:hypothetical protein
MSITIRDISARNFFQGLIRLRILVHTTLEPIFGLDMIRQVARHGYRLSPGTLLPGTAYDLAVGHVDADVAQSWYSLARYRMDWSGMGFCDQKGGWFAARCASAAWPPKTARLP